MLEAVASLTGSSYLSTVQPRVLYVDQADTSGAGGDEWAGRVKAIGYVCQMPRLSCAKNALCTD
eukprot:25290-Eustigmatos_ZCMA.PRE.1